MPVCFKYLLTKCFKIVVHMGYPILNIGLYKTIIICISRKLQLLEHLYLLTFSSGLIMIVKYTDSFHEFIIFLLCSSLRP